MTHQELFSFTLLRALNLRGGLRRKREEIDTHYLERYMYSYLERLILVTWKGICTHDTWRG